MRAKSPAEQQSTCVSVSVRVSVYVGRQSAMPKSQRGKKTTRGERKRGKRKESEEGRAVARGRESWRGGGGGEEATCRSKAPVPSSLDPQQILVYQHRVPSYKRTMVHVHVSGRI